MDSFFEAKEKPLDKNQMELLLYNDKNFNTELLIRFDSLQKRIADITHSERYIVPKSLNLDSTLKNIKRINSLELKIEKYYEYELHYQIEHVQSKYNNAIKRMNNELMKKKGQYETIEQYNSNKNKQKEKFENIKGELENKIKAIQMAFFNSLDRHKSFINEKRQILTNKIFQIESNNNNFSIEKIKYNPENQEFEIDAQFIINTNFQIFTALKIFFPINFAKQYGENPKLFDANILVKIDPNAKILPYKITIFDSNNKLYNVKSFSYSLKQTYYSNIIILCIICASFLFLFLSLILLNRFIIFTCIIILFIWSISYIFPFVYKNVTFFKDIVEDTYSIYFKVYDPLSYFLVGIAHVILSIPIIAFYIFVIGIGLLIVGWIQS